MNHIRYEEWLLYVQDTIDEEMRETYENHLYTCDHCLELYLQAVETVESELPQWRESSNFTDSVMVQVIGSTTKKQEKAYVKKNRKQQTMLHYFLAAAMTLILMSTGVFTQLMNVASDFERDESKQADSFVLTFLNKQDSITDKLEENFKAGDRNE